jgi:hypothetical protein
VSLIPFFSFLAELPLLMANGLLFKLNPVNQQGFFFLALG